MKIQKRLKADFEINTESMMKWIGRMEQILKRQNEAWPRKEGREKLLPKNRKRRQAQPVEVGILNSTDHTEME